MADKIPTKLKKATGKSVPKPTVKETKKAKPVPVKISKSKVGEMKTIPQKREDLDINHFLDLLYKERERLEEELEQVRSTPVDIENAIPEEGEGGGEEDTADMASALMDKEMDQSVEDEIGDMLTQVDHALTKIEEGTYGICDISGNAIPKSRLEAIPWASLTVECQALAEGD
ncbi:MAG: TraR/DksA C4-type zinc finger protein [Abditibacteriaceae bacterium]